MIQQDKLDKQKLLKELNQQSSIHQNLPNSNNGNNFNSRRSNVNNVRDLMYQISTFEDDMDKEIKKKKKFDIKKYKNE